MPAHKTSQHVRDRPAGRCLPAGHAAVSRAEPVTIQATLILASNDAAPLDSRLDKVEYKLRRIFGFEYYRHYGEGAAVLNLPGESTVELGHGFRLSDFRVRLQGRQNPHERAVVPRGRDGSQHDRRHEARRPGHPRRHFPRRRDAHRHAGGGVVTSSSSPTPALHLF